VPKPLLTVLEDCLDWTGGVVARIGQKQRDTTTPCPGFTVDRLVAHVIDGLTWYGQLPAGGATDPRAVRGPDLQRVRYDDAFRTARAGIRRNWTPHRLTDTYVLPFGEVTGAGITEYTIVEALGHGWDLAISTGQPINVAADLAETALTLAHGLGEQTLRAPGMMAAAATVETDAPAIDRFVAFLGRPPSPRTQPH
jgi:uncharacterized protein (TIGR03086 family)